MKIRGWYHEALHAYDRSRTVARFANETCSRIMVSLSRLREQYFLGLVPECAQFSVDSHGWPKKCLLRFVKVTLWRAWHTFLYYESKFRSKTKRTNIETLFFNLTILSSVQIVTRLTNDLQLFINYSEISEIWALCFIDRSALQILKAIRRHEFVNYTQIH